MDRPPESTESLGRRHGRHSGSRAAFGHPLRWLREIRQLLARNVVLAEKARREYEAILVALQAVNHRLDQGEQRRRRSRPADQLKRHPAWPVPTEIAETRGGPR